PRWPGTAPRGAPRRHRRTADGHAMQRAHDRATVFPADDAGGGVRVLGRQVGAARPHPSHSLAIASPPGGMLPRTTATDTRTRTLTRRLRQVLAEWPLDEVDRIEV